MIADAVAIVSNMSVQRSACVVDLRLRIDAVVALVASVIARAQINTIQYHYCIYIINFPPL